MELAQPSKDDGWLAQPSKDDGCFMSLAKYLESQSNGLDIFLSAQEQLVSGAWTASIVGSHLIVGVYYYGLRLLCIGLRLPLVLVYPIA